MKPIKHSNCTEDCVICERIIKCSIDKHGVQMYWCEPLEFILRKPEDVIAYRNSLLEEESRHGAKKGQKKAPTIDEVTKINSKQFSEDFFFSNKKLRDLI